MGIDPTVQEPGRLRMGQLAHEAGVSSETLRHYERLGVLATPPRSQGGQRLYPPDSRYVLHLIQTLQRLGFSLPTIAELFAATSPDPIRDVNQAQKSALLTDVRERLAVMEAVEMALTSPDPAQIRLP